MAYFVTDEKLQGFYVSGGVTINIVKYHFECDDAASLPAQTAFISSKNIKISMASTAHTIDTDTLYKMESSGAWVKQSQPWQPLADYSVLSNKPQINGHTLTGNQSGEELGLQNELTFDSTPTQSSTNPVTSAGVWTDQQRQDAIEAEDRAALIEQVDSGAKNLLRNTAVSTTASNGLTYTVNADKSVTVTGNASAYYAFTIAGSRAYANAMPLKRGTYIIKAGIAYDSSKPIFVQFGVMTSSEASISWKNIYDTDKELVVNNDTTRIVYEIYNPSGSYSGYNATFYPMICTTAAWKISHEFQPYRPSWQEMYDMILALQ